ncbi:glycosyltransferase family 2 protein [Paenibacillus puerhi]|uniref:glycosyltransferase family 2 protein n=1 Tax=Paenibacillus puerhi TaxID=2692622 RepID=UPI001357919C|nr:glycosyltransferase family 2 protein [Paenibacillus puerhi]
MNQYKVNYDLIFVVLTYRNIEDLKNFIMDTKKAVECLYKIIVVNSYFDETTHLQIQKIALDNDCDFINIENKGYGYGNNRGIEIAKERYSFRYLITSNPDVQIQSFSLKNLEGMQKCIVAPTIKTLSGKDQNPYYYSKIEFVEWIRYFSYIKERKLPAYIGFAINKIYRIIGLSLDRVLNIKRREIYACHGSFVIFGCEALDILGEVYNEKMFLFSEENHLARLALEKKIKTYMTPEIRVLHKEDGSVGLENEKMASYSRQSFILYYENWKKGNNRS